MTTQNIDYRAFGARLQVPVVEGWQLQTEYEWNDQMLVSLTRRVETSADFLKIFLLCVRGRRFNTLADFAGSFPQLVGKPAIPVRMGDREALLFHIAVRIPGQSGGDRMGIDRHYFIRDGDRFTALVVWNSPGLYELYKSEIDLLRDNLRFSDN